MSNIIKLSMIALLLAGCQNAYGPKIKNDPTAAPQKHATDHVGHVAKSTANTQAAASAGIKKQLGQ